MHLSARNCLYFCTYIYIYSVVKNSSKYISAVVDCINKSVGIQYPHDQCGSNIK